MMAHNSTCFLEVTPYPKGWNGWVCVAIQHEKDWVLARNIFGLAISRYVQLIARGSLNRKPAKHRREPGETPRALVFLGVCFRSFPFCHSFMPPCRSLLW